LLGCGVNYRKHILIDDDNYEEDHPMTYIVTHRMGWMERDFPLERLGGLYDELDDADMEHGGVSLTHESEWNLGLGGKGLLIWENVEDSDINPRHMNDVPKQKVLELWALLAVGDLETIDKEAWLPGYYDPD
jgi:hypothetical protein